MKKLPLILSVFALVSLSSCSNSEEILELQPEALIKDVTIQRGIDGSYAVNYIVGEGTATNVTEDVESNRKNIDFYASQEGVSGSFNENLLLEEKNSFQLGTYNRDQNTGSLITVYDQDIRFNKGAKDHLSSYSITDRGDGTYDLDFSVNEGIAVDFQLNEDTNHYEIYLEEGDSDESKYSRTFEKNDDENLVIIFLNRVNAGATSRGTSYIRKPIVVVNDGGSVQ